MSASQRFGLWEIRDQSWLGDDKGPVLYSEKRLAAAAATILAERMRTMIVPREWVEEQVHYKGEVDVEISGEEAVKRIEGRCEHEN